MIGGRGSVRCEKFVVVSPLFNEPVLVVRQQVNAFNLEAHYTIYHPQGAPVANVNEQASAGKKALRFLSKDHASNLRRVLHVTDPGNGAPLLHIDKAFAFALPKTTITGPNGEPLGSINKDVTLARPRFTLRDPANNEVARLQGNFLERNFSVTDNRGTELARVMKQYDGIARQLFTNADTYVFQMMVNVQGPFRALLTAVAITADIVLWER